jgi:hypothetical protein
MGRTSSANKRRESPSRRRSIGTRGTIFCDEAGFTGNNLLDREQEIFTFAGVALSHDAARHIVERTIADFGLQGKELKGSRMLKSEAGRRAITAVIEECAPHTRVVCHLKKYALACKFFEYIFEPALADQNSIFYGCRFNSFISTILFLHLRVRAIPAETIFEEFSKFMRTGDEHALQSLFPSGGPIVDPTADPIQAISVFAMMNRRHILEELEAIRGDGSTPNWILDLTTTSLFSTLCYWGERFEELEVYCDRSKPLEAEAEFLKCMIGRKDRTRIRMFGKERQMIFNLVRLPEMVDSSKCPGVQIADVIASALARAFQNRWRNQVDETEKRWVKLTRQSFLDENIWPDFDDVDLERRLPFVNSLLLTELTDRCIKKKDLFDGIPEFILAAHETYPKFLAEVHQRT